MSDDVITPEEEISRARALGATKPPQPRRTVIAPPASPARAGAPAPSIPLATPSQPPREPGYDSFEPAPLVTPPMTSPLDVPTNALSTGTLEDARTPHLATPATTLPAAHTLHEADLEPADVDLSTGSRRFNQRVLSLYLPRATKQLLDAERERRTCARGAILLEALEVTYAQVLETLEVTSPPRGRFGAQPRPRRQVDDGVAVQVYVTPNCADALADMSRAFEASVSLVACLALDTYLGPPRLEPLGTSTSS